MKFWSSLRIGIVAVGWLGAAASPSVAQGLYYPPPAWAQTLPARTRFVPVLFEEVCANSICAQVAQGILDRETGLVWERSPGDSLLTWPAARLGCLSMLRGKRYGWRLPSADELTSLRVLTNTSSLHLPPGHPFFNVAADFYWTSTEWPSENVVAISFGQKTSGIFHQQEELFHAWCVRGGAR